MELFSFFCLLCLVKVAGVAGLEPTKCQNQNLVPYQLGYTPIKKIMI